jgi:L-2-hydroxyglutarate oxidase LhgO
MPELDVLVIGAGVTGLATAAQLAADGQSVCVAERHTRPGLDTSTHNSGVIHAGLYYPRHSLKAKLCVEGARLLYEFAARYGVPHDRCGKFVVATDDGEVGDIEKLQQRGRDNGVEGLEIVDDGFIRAREPHVVARAALWSPATGRVDASALVRALLRVAQAAGATFLPASRVIDGTPRPDGGIDVRLERETIAARTVVNAAGLYADDVSAALGGERFTIYPCRGEYAELKPSRREWVNGLVYPLPHASGHGLGVHLTKTVGGSVLLGPTARFQARKDDYEEDRLPLESFVGPTQKLAPMVSLDDITYGGSGIRAKLHPPSESFADFLIRADRQQPALIHAAGMDSPGLTSCLAVGRLVASLVNNSPGAR